MARLLCLVAACAAVAGCADETSIELTLEGDLLLGADTDELELSMWRSGAQIWSLRDRPGPGDRLPRAYTIERTSEGDRLVELRVAASLYGKGQVEARREATFASGKSTPVRLCLWRECIGSDAGWCLDGTCDEPPSADGDGDADADEDGDTDSDMPVDGDGLLPDGDDPGEDAGPPLCSNDCVYANNGICGDGGEGSTGAECAYGHDCGDCGTRRPEDCVSQCHIRVCGPDHCGGTCGPGCGPLEECAFGGVCVEWVDIHPDGPFLMGSPDSEPGGKNIEVQHEVTLRRSFTITRREVSQRWMASIAGMNLSSYPSCGLDCPADSMSWVLAASMCNSLSIADGLASCYECLGTSVADYGCELAARWPSPYDCEGYRLPTEAEWEYAARGGTTTGTYAGELDRARLECETPNPTLDPIAWFCGNAPDTRPQPRGLLAENPYGLLDMIGNVFEFVHDYYQEMTADAVVDPWGPATGTDRVFHGGSFMSNAWECRAAGRGQIGPNFRGINIGFRVARTIGD